MAAKKTIKKKGEKKKEVKKKVTSKKDSKKPTKRVSKKPAKSVSKKTIKKDIPTLNLKTEKEIAMDFATKVYRKFNKIIKSIILFGSVNKKKISSGSDIDIIIILDDVSINWDQQLIAWYRAELEKIIRVNPYGAKLHINTIKLSTWWGDLLRGDPVILNILRDGESMIDFGGFFEPLKYLLIKGKIRSTPESIYSLLQRAPYHLSQSKLAEMGAIEGVYWAMVDSSQAALSAAGIEPSSPEHIPIALKEVFVDKGKLKLKYVIWYRDLLILHKKIAHREVSDLKGVEIDKWQERADEFIKTMFNLVKRIVS